MSLLKLGSLDLGSCPACGRKLFPAAYVIRNGQRFHPECFRRKRARRATSTNTTLPPPPRPAERRTSPAPLAP